MRPNRKMSELSVVKVARSVRAAVQVLLAACSGEERVGVCYPWTHAGRTEWNSGPRERTLGLKLAELSPTVRPLVDVVASLVLSPHGLRAVWNIRSLEQILGRLEGGRPHRDPDRYWLQIFHDEQFQHFTVRWEGHHCSLNITVIGDDIWATPLFRATNPACVPDGDRAGWRVLAAEEDAGHAWLAACTLADRAQVIQAGEVPKDIQTGLASTLTELPFSTAEASLSELSAAAQCAALAALAVWSGHLEASLAQAWWQRVQPERETRVAWFGSIHRGEPHYWRLWNPRFVLEFTMVQNGGNHIHAVLRDVVGDFGATT